ncbi:hypothetical protein MA16_Dca012557 [Dendrobium catenatum]|uniref:Uncharacterized protein n=1 Tax=Dendrobium catenatum TaxID=906689 RepID=A0A2I0VKP3_9ASPA|nr:hypothetical protein MA16_Dca012557 [Dendrobium catenatum]
MAIRKAQISCFFLILLGMAILLQQGNVVAAQNAPTTEDNEVVINIKARPPPDDFDPVDPCCGKFPSCCHINPSINGRKLFSKVL